MYFCYSNYRYFSIEDSKLQFGAVHAVPHVSLENINSLQIKKKIKTKKKILNHKDNLPTTSTQKSFEHFLHFHAFCIKKCHVFSFTAPCIRGHTQYIPVNEIFKGRQGHEKHKRTSDKYWMRVSKKLHVKVRKKMTIFLSSLTPIAVGYVSATAIEGWGCSGGRWEEGGHH